MKSLALLFVFTVFFSKLSIDLLQRQHFISWNMYSTVEKLRKVSGAENQECNVLVH